jgi:Fe-S-cluster containining protein
MPFDHCAECRRCCYVEQGYPPLEISLTRNENKKLGGICIETQCPNLGPTGCTLGDQKPFSCTLYPLVYDPEARNFYFDTECPLMPEYIRQLKSQDSEAARHLATCKKEIARLEKSDRRFLASNFAIDADYFDLKKLPIPRFGEGTKP